MTLPALRPIITWPRPCASTPDCGCWLCVAEVAGFSHRAAWRRAVLIRLKAHQEYPALRRSRARARYLIQRTRRYGRR